MSEVSVVASLSHLLPPARLHGPYPCCPILCLDSLQGITAAVLFYALIRSLDDNQAATDDSVVLATGMEVTGDGVPKSLADLHAGLIQIKSEMRKVSIGVSN